MSSQPLNKLFKNDSHSTKIYQNWHTCDIRVIIIIETNIQIISIMLFLVTRFRKYSINKADNANFGKCIKNVRKYRTIKLRAGSKNILSAPNLSHGPIFQIFKYI